MAGFYRHRMARDEEGMAGHCKRWERECAPWRGWLVNDKGTESPDPSEAAERRSRGQRHRVRETNADKAIYTELEWWL